MAGVVSVAVRVAVFALAVVLCLCLGCVCFVLCVGEHQVLWWCGGGNKKMARNINECHA